MREREREEGVRHNDSIFRRSGERLISLVKRITRLVTDVCRVPADALIFHRVPVSIVGEANGEAVASVSPSLPPSRFTYPRVSCPLMTPTLLIR